MLTALVIMSACTIPADPAVDPPDASQSGLTLFDDLPDEVLPVLLDAMLLYPAADLVGEAYFVTQSQGATVWAAKATEGRICILYEFVGEHGGAIAKAVGGSCQLSEERLMEAGGGVVYAGPGPGLLAIGLAVDGFDEVITSRGQRYLVENNGFVVPLLPVMVDGMRLEFDGFSLVGSAGTLPADQLAHPDSGQLVE